jgi:hypothetical protein
MRVCIRVCFRECVCFLLASACVCIFVFVCVCVYVCVCVRAAMHDACVRTLIEAVHRHAVPVRRKDVVHEGLHARTVGAAKHSRACAGLRPQQ